LELTNTAVVANPIATPFMAAVVTAKVGHIPKTNLNTGFWDMNPLLKSFHRPIFFYSSNSSLCLWNKSNPLLTASVTAREEMVAPVMASMSPPSFFTASLPSTRRELSRDLPLNCPVNQGLVIFAPSPGVSKCSNMHTPLILPARSIPMMSLIPPLNPSAERPKATPEMFCGSAGVVVEGGQNRSDSLQFRLSLLLRNRPFGQVIYPGQKRPCQCAGEH